MTVCPRDTGTVDSCRRSDLQEDATESGGVWHSDTIELLLYGSLSFLIGKWIDFRIRHR